MPRPPTPFTLVSLSHGVFFCPDPARRRAPPRSAAPLPWRAPSEPRSASLWPPVHYARHGGAPRPNRTPSGPRERWNGFPRRAHRRGAVLRRPSAAARGPAHPWSSDLAWTIRIRSRTNLILALRSRSNSLEPPIPARPGLFAKEPLRFPRINLPSRTV